MKRLKSKIIYEYDFGDNWEHEISLEKKFPPESDAIYPRCIGGKMACPPEDCGGISGFYNMLDCLNDPKNNEYESIKEWLRKKYDPKHFDLEASNREIKKLKIHN